MSEKFYSKSIHLSLKNSEGSVEHYYHFLLGYMVPLVLAREEIVKSTHLGKAYVRSCAIMDEHINSIGFKELTIIDKLLHEEIKSDKSRIKHKIVIDEFVKFCGYDHPSLYDFSAFVKAKKLIINEIDADVKKYTNLLKKNDLDGEESVVIVNREAPHNFYTSNKCEIKGAGNSRRSVPNIGDLYNKVALKHPNTQLVSLENKPLAYQIALFQHADIIVSQHGAALANLIWCKPNSVLVEIYPADMQRNIYEINFFGELAECMKLQYHRVNQENMHSPVNINLVLEAMQN